MSIETVCEAARQHLDRLSDRLRCFHKNECQVEAWLKGELLYMLGMNVEQLSIDQIESETKTPEGRIDLSVHFASGQSLWIELKHWHIGRQSGTLWRAVDCLGVEGAFGLTKDVRKLVSGGRRGAGYAMLLFTANPGQSDWLAGIEAFNRRSTPLRLEPLTDATTFPPEYFLGVAKASMFKSREDNLVASQPASSVSGYSPTVVP